MRVRLNREANRWWADVTETGALLCSQSLQALCSKCDVGAMKILSWGEMVAMVWFTLQDYYRDFHVKMSELEYETHAFSLASLEQLGLESLNQQDGGTQVGNCHHDGPAFSGWHESSKSLCMSEYIAVGMFVAYGYRFGVRLWVRHGMSIVSAWKRLMINLRVTSIRTQ